jgi:hypothetical protein
MYNTETDSTTILRTQQKFKRVHGVYEENKKIGTGSYSVPRTQ